jgi:hypothetical protein
LRGRYIDYVGGLQGFWPFRAVERRSRDRCIKLVGILTIVALKMTPSLTSVSECLLAWYKVCDIVSNPKL